MLSDAVRVVREAASQLESAGVPEAAASAEVLMAELLGVHRSDLLLGQVSLDDGQRAVYEAWISRRKRREPVQRILNYGYFRHLKLDLNDETLIPRADTESVVDAAVEMIDRRKGHCRVLDVGTGSGAIAISIAKERPRCEVHATDYSRVALEVARLNADVAGAQVVFRQEDLLPNLTALPGRVSLLISNPPYVRSEELADLPPEVREWDPQQALDGGPDGLSFYRRIFEESPPLLEDDADIVLEVGDGQHQAVIDLGRAADFIPEGTRNDLTGTPRAVLLRWSG
ncbi:peptide chain release factor N(5)-glutamine methyltransferase [soil metagenome]